MLYLGKSFQGHWEDRIDGLFDMGVEFQAASVLDIGCNMGIVGYEVCKHGPVAYCGVEGSRVHAFVAEMIFKGVSTPSRIVWGNITKPSVRKKLFEQRYDVVLYLAVHQHIRKQVGQAVAADVLSDLFEHCTKTLVFRGPDLEEVSEMAKRHGFVLGETGEKSRVHRLSLFHREQTTGT